MALHANEWWMVEHGNRLLRWSNERQLVDIETYGQIVFCTRPLDVGRQKFRLQIH